VEASSTGRRITIPTFFGLPQARAWFGAWLEVRDAPELTIVIPPKTFFGPSGVTWLAAGIVARDSAGKDTRIELDPASDSARYLQCIDFFNGLGIEFSPPPVGAPTAERFVELRAITSKPVAAKLAVDIVEDLAGQFASVPLEVRRKAKLLLEELGVNIVQHSAAERTGFAVVQCLPQSPRIQISFCDAGQGFLASVGRHFEFGSRITDEGKVLELALHDEITFSESSENSGVGLRVLRTFSDQLEADLWIASGQSLLHRTSVAGQRVSSVSAIPEWRGAWIGVDLRLPSVPDTLA
jgi:anti-sigma regulatory factor (Ser/Thr protein kinase)